jgi:hypothetical protein
MASRLDRADLMQRFKAQGDNLVIQVGGFIQGGVLSAAAFSLIEIFRTQDDTLVRLFLWLSSVLISLVVFFRTCLRAPFLTRAGLDVLFMLPVMGIFEILLFAVLTSTALGPDSWRYWFVAAALFGLSGYAATWLNLRAVKSESYDESIAVVPERLAGILRRACRETIAGIALQTVLSIWILSMAADWPYALAFVTVQLALTLVAGTLVTRQEALEVAALRDQLDV